ncbi:MAG: polysaccharide pyruvyl transferase CsaB [Synergistales bacterium]|nr:polysaccharide pyruvyl transferase CsaB [Synergistales bacterium]
MPRKRRSFDVALCGYYGFGNLGDEVLAATLTGGLERLGIPRRRQCVLSADPGAISQRFGVAAVNRWRPREVWKALRSSRTLLLGGGGLLQDATSVRSCLYYWGVVRLARRAGCRPWVFGQSIGPLRSRLGRWLARGTLVSCSPRCVRDRPSLELLASMGMSGELAPDPAFLLGAMDRGEADRGNLLVNLRPWDGRYEALCADVVERYAKECGLSLVAVALSPEDAALMERFADEGRLSVETIESVRGPEEIAGIWAMGDRAAGMRLHFVLFSVLCARPVTVLPYDPKVRALAGSCGIPLWEGRGALPNPQSASVDPQQAARQVERVLGQAWTSVREGMADGG